MPQENCKMMFPIAYLVTNQVWEYTGTQCKLVWDLWLTTTTFILGLCPDHNPRLPCIIFYVRLSHSNIMDYTVPILLHLVLSQTTTVHSAFDGNNTSLQHWHLSKGFVWCFLAPAQLWYRCTNSSVATYSHIQKFVAFFYISPPHGFNHHQLAPSVECT